MRVGIIVSCCFLAACSTRPSIGDAVQAQKVPQSTNPFTTFETLQVRPLALSPSGKLLFALNTPDNRLEIFETSQGNGLSSRGSSPTRSVRTTRGPGPSRRTMLTESDR